MTLQKKSIPTLAECLRKIQDHEVGTDALYEIAPEELAYFIIGLYNRGMLDRLINMF